MENSPDVSDVCSDRTMAEWTANIGLRKLALTADSAPCIETRGTKDNFIFVIIICFFFLFILTFLIENLDNTLVLDILLPDICGK